MKVIFFFVFLCKIGVLTYVAVATACPKPPQVANAAILNELRIYEPGQEVVYTCLTGFISIRGPKKLVCPKTGRWGFPMLLCERRSCPAVDSPLNGGFHATDLKFQSIMTFSCNEGYILKGANISICQHDGTWSTAVPVCEPVTCPPPEVPTYGKIHYYEPRAENVSLLNDVVQFECLYRTALIGNSTAYCMSNGNWSQIPECQDVICPYPGDIKNGHLVYAHRRDYSYREVLRYACKTTFTLDGPMEITCEKNGEWSSKPSCKASCIIPVKRGRILYNTRKLWIEDIPDQTVQHADTVFFYCKDEKNNCGYPVSAQCVDSVIKVPDCFKEPTFLQYNVRFGSLPSEIEQCKNSF